MKLVTNKDLKPLDIFQLEGTPRYLALWDGGLWNKIENLCGFQAFVDILIENLVHGLKLTCAYIAIYCLALVDLILSGCVNP